MKKKTIQIVNSRVDVIEKLKSSVHSQSGVIIKSLRSNETVQTPNVNFRDTYSFTVEFKKIFVKCFLS